MRDPLLLRSCNAAPPAQAVPRTGRLRRVDGDDAAVRPGADAVGRAAPGPLAAGWLADGPGHHRGQLRGAADVDPAPAEAGLRHAVQRDRDRAGVRPCPRMDRRPPAWRSVLVSYTSE